MARKKRRLRVLIITLCVLVVAFAGLIVFIHRASDFTASPESIDHVLASVPYEPHIETLDYEGRPIHYVEVGDPSKPTVLFVHGSPGSWDNYLGMLSNHDLLGHVRIISVDRPGFGKSGLGDHEPSLQRQAAALMRVLDRRSPEQPAILVGHSYGGPVIARMAMDFPDRVAALILVAASVDPALEETKWYQIPADWLPIAALLPPNLVATNREILALKAELETMLPLWKTITAPTTVIQGGADILVPAGNADFAERMLTNSSVDMVRIPDMNHFVPWQHPHLITDAIKRYATATTMVQAQP